MFSGIYFHHQVADGPDFDLGALAEAMLFYDRVYAAGGPGTVYKLLQHIPPFTLLGLLEDGRLALRVKTDHAMVITENTGQPSERHAFVLGAFPAGDIDTEVARIFVKAAGGTSQAKVAARKFCRLVRPVGHDGFDDQQAARDVQDEGFAKEGVRSILGHVAKGYPLPEPFEFRVENVGGLYAVRTNIDFQRANSVYHQRIPPEHSSLTPALLLANLQTVSEELYYASLFSSELSASGYKKDLLRLKVNAIMKKSALSELQRASFVELVLRESYAIREAVNAGKVSWGDLRRLYGRADRFREWLKKQPESEELVSTYYREVVRESWAEKLPGKTTRWGIMTGIGAATDALASGSVGTLVGAALGAIDIFWLDRLLKGWRPNHFVEGDLRDTFGNGEPKT